MFNFLSLVPYKSVGTFLCTKIIHNPGRHIKTGGSESSEAGVDERSDLTHRLWFSWPLFFKVYIICSQFPFYFSVHFFSVMLAISSLLCSSLWSAVFPLGINLCLGDFIQCHRFFILFCLALSYFIKFYYISRDG